MSSPLGPFHWSSGFQSYNPTDPRASWSNRSSFAPNNGSMSGNGMSGGMPGMNNAGPRRPQSGNQGISAQQMQQMSSMFGPSMIQNWMNRMPQQAAGSPGQQGTNSFSQWMQQTPMAYGQGQGQQGQQQNPMSMMFGSQQGPSNVRAADFLSEAFMRDYLNHANARNQAQGLMGGFLNNMQQVPQMGMSGVNMALQNGQQGMDIARQGMEAMMGQAKFAQKQAKRTRQDVSGAMSLASGNMQQGIDTMRDAISKRENEGILDISAGVSGIRSQYSQQRNSIMSDPNMSEEERDIALSNLNQMVNQQASAYSGQAQRQIDDSMASMRSALSGMQMNMGSTLGSLGMQGAGLNASTGMQAAGMGMQAAQAGYQLMSAQSQFAGGLAQQAMANAMDAMVRGNALGAEMAMNMPLGMPNIADTILAMMNVQGMRPGHMVSPGMSGRIGGLLGNTGFRGYA